MNFLIGIVCTIVVGASNAASPPSPFDPTTICAQTNVTDADDCCICFHSTCDLVKANCPLGTSGTNLFNYFDLQYCALNNVPAVSYLILCCWILIVFSLLGTTADNFFVVQLETLSESLRLSPSTAAITLLALGNSSPDVFSDLAAVQGNNDFNLAIGELVGASMFLTTVVLSAVIFYATALTTNQDNELLRKVCKVDKTPIRDILSFFIVLAAVLSFSLTDGIIDIVEASLLIGAYVIYVTCVIVYTKMYDTKNLHRRSSLFDNSGNGNGNGNRARNATNTQSLHEALIQSGAAQRNEDGKLQPTTSFVVNEDTDSDDDSNDDDDDAETMIGIDWDVDATLFEKVTFVIEYPFSILRWLSIATADQRWSKRRRYINTFVPAGAITIVFLDFSPNWTGGTAYAFFTTQSYLISMIVGIVIGILMFFTSDNSTNLPKWNSVLVFMAFVSTVAWLDLLGNECVAVLESIGTITGITETSVGHSILGVTVLAWANSIGDFIADTAVTRAGKPAMGVSSVFGSPMLTCCLGIGISVLVGSSVNGKGYVKATLDDELIVSFIFLAISLISSLVVIVVSDYRLPRWYGYYLLTLYASYMIISILVVAHVLPQWFPEPISVDCPKL